MSMRVVFLKEYGDYKTGFQGFIPRQLGRRLCQQGITIPWSEMKPQKIKKPKLKKPKRKSRKKAVSKKVMTRELAVTEI